MTELDIYDELPDAASGSTGGGGGASSSSGSAGGGGAASCMTNGCTIEIAYVDQCGSPPTVEIQYNEGGGASFSNSPCMRLNTSQKVQFALSDPSFTCTLRGGFDGKPDPYNPIELASGGVGLKLTTDSSPMAPISLSDFGECTVPFYCEKPNDTAKGAIFVDTSCPP